MVQKKALAIILDNSYLRYEFALSELNLERLDDRRLQLCYSFALKCSSSSRHSSMFPLNPNFRPDMQSPKPFLERLCHKTISTALSPFSQDF